jgi:hypothetical protein
MDYFQDDYQTQNTHISCLTHEILADILKFFDVDIAQKYYLDDELTEHEPTSDGKFLVNFWIACYGDNRMIKRIDMAMFALNNLPMNLAKTLGSEFTRYVTDIPLHICESSDTLQIILNMQKHKQRINRLVLGDVGSDILLLEKYKQFESATHAICGPKFLLDAENIFNTFPNLVSLDAGRHNLKFKHESVQKIYPKINEILNVRHTNLSFLNEKFPNIVRLSFVGLFIRKDTVDLSNLIFMQEFAWRDFVFDSQISSGIKIIFSGNDLRVLHINKIMQIEAKTGFLNKLYFLNIDCSESEHISDDLIQSNISNIAGIVPNLEHLVIDNADNIVISVINKFSRIGNIEFNDINCAYENVASFLKNIPKFRNLTKLKFCNVKFGNVVNFDDDTFLQIVEMIWIGVKYNSGMSVRLLYPPIDKMPNLQKLKIDSPIGTNKNFISHLVKVESLHVINRSSYVRIPSAVTGEDFNVVYAKPAFHSIDFLSFFHGHRISQARNVLFAQEEKVCHKLIFETSETHKVKSHLDTHNTDIDRLHLDIFHHGRSCGAYCKFYDKCSLYLQFIYRHDQITGL